MAKLCVPRLSSEALVRDEDPRRRAKRHSKYIKQVKIQSPGKQTFLRDRFDF